MEEMFLDRYERVVVPAEKYQGPRKNLRVWRRAVDGSFARAMPLVVSVPLKEYYTAKESSSGLGRILLSH